MIVSMFSFRKVTFHLDKETTMNIKEISISHDKEFNYVILAQNQCSAKSEIFVFPETSDEFSRSHGMM